MAFLLRVRENLRILLMGLLFVQLAGCAGLSSGGAGTNGNSGGGATAPAAPTGLLATAGNAEVSLTWSASSWSYGVLRPTRHGERRPIRTNRCPRGE